MARQILKGSDLGNWGDAYAEGRKQREEELYRRAAQDMEAQQWAEGRYKKATKSPEGYFGGYISDEDSRSRDLDKILNRVPWARPADPTKPNKSFQEIPGVKALVGPKSGTAAKTFTSTPEREAEVDKWFNELGGRAPQSGQLPPQPMQERPLLANPQKEKMAVDQTGNPVKLVGAAAEAENVRADENKAIPAISSTGKPADVLMAEGMLQNQKNEAAVGGKPLAPPVEQAPSIAEESARVPADFNPSDSYLARLAEYSTTGQAKETQPQIAVGNLPEKWQRLVLGKQPEDPITPQEQAITVPADIVKAVVEQSYKPQAATKAPVEFDSALADAIGQIEAGDPLNTVVRKLTVARGGKLPKADMDQLQQAKARFDANKRAEKIAGLRQENIETTRAEKAVEKQDKSVERYKKALNDTGVLDALPFLQQIEMETGVVTGKSPDKGKLPGVGTNMARNLIPFIGDSVAMAMAKTYKGGGASQALQGLVNAKIRNTAGQTVTKYEQGRVLAEYGMSAFGTERDIANGIKLMYEGIRENYQNLNASFPPEIVELFQSRGGTLGPENALSGLREAGLAVDKKAGKSSNNKQENPEYESELKKAQSMMAEYRDRIQKEMQSKGLGAAWASRKINQAKQEADNYLKQKYKKGFVDVQNP